MGSGHAPTTQRSATAATRPARPRPRRRCIGEDAQVCDRVVPIVRRHDREQLATFRVAVAARCGLADRGLGPLCGIGVRARGRLGVRRRRRSARPGSGRRTATAGCLRRRAGLRRRARCPRLRVRGRGPRDCRRRTTGRPAVLAPQRIDRSRATRPPRRSRHLSPPTMPRTNARAANRSVVDHGRANAACIRPIDSAGGSNGTSQSSISSAAMRSWCQPVVPSRYSSPVARRRYRCRSCSHV